MAGATTGGSVIFRKGNPNIMTENKYQTILENIWRSVSSARDQIAVLHPDAREECARRCVSAVAIADPATHGQRRVIAAAQAWAERVDSPELIEYWNPVDRELYLAVQKLRGAADGGGVP